MLIREISFANFSTSSTTSNARRSSRRIKKRITYGNNAPKEKTKTSDPRSMPVQGTDAVHSIFIRSTTLNGLFNMLKKRYLYPKHHTVEGKYISNFELITGTRRHQGLLWLDNSHGMVHEY